MKTAGLIFVCFGVLNLIVAFIALGSEASDAFGNKISAALMLGAIGGYLIYRAEQKKKEKEDKQRWNDGK